ncbi:MAG: PPE family protein [Mycobacterium sp.]|uniref:PPE family protein n=1 Tax=Mycobacterium sp. TaxID=1785 RepID=UPI003F993B3A
MSDLGALPPEVSSALIYSGPGSSSLTSAAAAWNALAAELASTAQGMDKVVSQLASESWLGPTSAAMVAAVQPYVSWVSTTAGQAEHAAAQAQSAAAAFETVFASVVPPPLIAANRAELAQAVQTNILGLNQNVIAQLEAQYGEFWANNASAMYGYAGSSAAATKISSFTDAPAIANPAAALSSTASTAATPATSIQSYLQGILTNVQARIQSLTGPFIGPTATGRTGLTEIWFLLTGQTILPTNLGALTNGYAPFASFFYNTEGLPYFSVGMGNFGTQISKSAGWLGGAAPAAAAAVPKGIGGLGGAGGGAGGQVAAGLGSGAHVAGLSVPNSWPGATLPSAAKPMSAIPVSEPITSGGSGAGNLIGGMPVGGTGAARGAGVGPRYGFKPTVMPRPMSAG